MSAHGDPDLEVLLPQADGWSLHPGAAAAGLDAVANTNGALLAQGADRIVRDEQLLE